MKTQKREIEMTDDNDNDKMETWTASNIGESGARMISESLKSNTTLTELDLDSDEKWSKTKWTIIIIQDMKEWKNEMKRRI